MASNNQQYTVPLAIDPSGFLTGLEEMESGLVSITSKAKGASAAITEAMTSSNKAGDALVTKMNQGAQAAKNLSDAAKTAGVDLNKTFAPENIKTDAIKAKITEFTQVLRNAAGKPIDFKFNIDQLAVKGLVDKLTQAKGEMQAFNLVLDSAKERLKGLAPGTQAFSELNTQIETAESFLKELGGEAEQTTQKVLPLRTQLKNMKQELQEMELAGKGGTQEFKELAKRAGEVADQIQDTSQRIKNLASDTKLLDAGITAIRGLAGAFAVGQGALAAFGEQSEEAARAIQKVQGALAILQGIQEVANVLNKDSALIVYLNTFAKKANTTATVENTVATEANAAATGVATTATEGFTAALLLNPFVAIAALLVAITAAIYYFATAQDDAKFSVKELNEELKKQQEILQSDLGIIQRRQQIDEATANAARAHQSTLTQIKINGLKKELELNAQDIESKKKYLNQLEVTNDEELKAYVDLQSEIRKAEEGQKKTTVALQASIIEQQKQFTDERYKLALEILRQKQEEVEAEKTILNEARSLQNQINQTQLAELEDGQQKELAILRQTLNEKLSLIDIEGEAKLRKLQNDRKALDLDIETDREVLALKKKALEEQILLEEANGVKRLELKKALQEAEAIQETKLAIKHAQEKYDFENDLLIRNLNLEKDSADKRIAILQAQAEKELQLIQQNAKLTEDEKNRLSLAVTEKFEQDSNEASLDFKLQQIEIEKTGNENKLKETQLYFNRAHDAQAYFHLLQAQNELEASEKALQALKDAGKKEGDQEYENARNRVNNAKKGVDDATKDAKPQNLFELLFPKDEASQRNAQEFMKSLNEVGKAIDAFYSMEVAAQQKKLDSQKKLVDADEEAISKLQDQLKEEQSLRDKGYANNVDGIKGLLAEKNKQREEDIRKAEEHQKKMAKIQKAQITAQTILQGVQLATAATNILLHSTAEGGAVGALIGALAVAGMIGAFVVQKKAAYDAVNETTSFGDGGIIKGKSHAQGGQKYYAPDGTGGIMELEEGEQVVNKKQTEKYLPLLEAINHDKLKDMDNDKILNLLDGLGVHLQTDRQHKEALTESREHTSHQINQITIDAAPRTPKELVSIDNTLQQMANRNHEQVQTWEEKGYQVIRKGNNIKKIRKH